MQIFVISLKQSVERRKYITEQFNKLGLQFSFFDAYLGTNYFNNSEYYDDKKARKNIHRSLKAGEVGCALSHNAVYKLIVEQHIPYALICEDDIVVSNDLPVVLDKVVPYLRGPSIITLDRCDVYRKKVLTNIYKDYYITKPRYIREGGMANASGYVLTYEAAKAIATINFPAWCPADSWGAYLKAVDFCGIIPTQTIIHQNKKLFNSTIQSDGIKNEITNDYSDKVETFSAFTLWKYGLKTYVPLTSHVYRFARWIYRHTIMKIKNFHLDESI